MKKTNQQPVAANGEAVLLYEGIREAVEQRIDLLGPIYGWPVTPENRAEAALNAMYGFEIDTFRSDLPFLREVHQKMTGNEQGLLDDDLECYYEPMMPRINEAPQQPQSSEGSS
jgi:hypothetical protein